MADDAIDPRAKHQTLILSVLGLRSEVLIRVELEHGSPQRGLGEYLALLDAAPSSMLEKQARPAQGT